MFQGTIRAATIAASVAIAGAALHGQNVVPNPGFEGGGGQVLPIAGGIVNAAAGAPDSWRAFAVGATSAIDLEVIPVAADELFAGSPATNAVLLRLNGVGTDQGFDDDNGRFPVLSGLDHHLEVYVRSANADSSAQTYNIGFPLFNQGGTYLGMEPGGATGSSAGPDWQLVVGPTFRPQEPVAQGHISFRCVVDGGEDAILIALPSVTSSGVQVLPTDLTCDKQGSDVTLAWVNHAAHTSLAVLRDGAQIAALAVDATTYTDVAVPDGVHVYQVLATAGGDSGGPSCEVAVFAPPSPGAAVSVDLNEVDLESGLQNTFRDGATDGENEFVLCGPELDLREGRSCWQGDDPTPDFPDPLFYFTVTDPAMKAQQVFRLDLEVYDDATLAGLSLYLQHTNAAATGAADIANTFFPLAAPPVRTLGGSGAWTTLSWDIEDAGFRSFQQGVADFRVGVAGGPRVCVDRATLTYFPRPVGLACRVKGGDVELAWTNGAPYAAIRILRDGAEVASLPGNAASYVDADVPDGAHGYQVVVELGDLEGGPTCDVTVFTVAPGTMVSVDFGALDDEDGLANVLGRESSDGENELVVCGPDEDSREGRSNLGDEDPTPDAPDGNFYFTVLDEAMKAQSAFTLRVTIHDDVNRAGAPIALQYTNAASTGPGDLPNTFFPLEDPPVRTLGGTGGWVELEWEITDAGFRSFQQGFADFRLIVADGGRICIDRADLIFTGDGPPPGPTFHRGDSNDDGKHNISDPVNTLNVLFLGLGRIPCEDAADSNDDGKVNISDPVNSLNVLFLGIGNVPPPLPPEALQPCGADPTPTEPPLGCGAYTSC